MGKRKTQTFDWRTHLLESARNLGRTKKELVKFLQNYSSINNIGLQIEESTDIISNLGKAYLQGETAHKRRIASSVFPKGLIFDDQKVRTLQINEVIARILNIDKGFGSSKKRKHTKIGVLSLGGGPGEIRTLVQTRN